MLKNIKTKKIITFLILLSLTLGNTFADVKTDINNMRNSTQQP
jgi:NADH:ubiquinone oxidoreductase subunit 2 (subunit N)